MLLKIEDMTLEQKLGMLCCARNFSDMDYILELVRKRALGCIQVSSLYADIAQKIVEEADYPILVFNDTEAGFSDKKLPPIPLMSLAACGKKEYYRAYAKWVSNEATEAGFNGTWGPIVDIVHKPKNLSGIPNGSHRRLSNNPYTIIEATSEIAAVYKQNRYLSTAKHYPGGDPGFDTHMTEGICDRTAEELLEFELIPYFELLKKDLMPCVMVGHTVYKNIDPDRPASLSKKVIDVLRDKVGFDGILFTDSLAMMGIIQKYGEENIYGMAIAAGNDIVLHNYRTTVEETMNYLKKSYEDGVFSEERLNESVRRILKAMEFVGEKPENPLPFTEEDEQLLRNVAKDCITAVVDDDLSVNITTPDKERMFVIVERTEVEDGSDINEITFAEWYDSKRIAEKIKEEFPESEVVSVPEFSTYVNHERILNKARDYKEIVFVTYCHFAPYLGVDELTKRTESLMNALLQSKKLSTVVHFGTPYAIKNLIHIPRKIFGYMIPDSQDYAIDVLKGNIEAKGKLPYEIDFK